MSEPGISVIVPVYGTQPYLKTCLNSILGQTYQNLEILLIEDGSPDLCGQICDRYAERDPRIRVIHQENKGLAAARNTGLAAATGEWIGWVDSDDWIEPEMFATLLRSCRQTESEVAVCGWAAEFPRRSVRHPGEAAILNGPHETMKALLQRPFFQQCVWNKLWRAELYRNVTFPVGVVSEDTSTSYRLLSRAKRVCCVTDLLYHYVQRGNTISHSTELNYSVEYYRAARARLEDLAADFPELRRELENECLVAIAFCWCHFYCNAKEERRYYSADFAQMNAFSKECAGRLFARKSLGNLAKLVVPLTKSTSSASFLAAYVLGWLYRKKRGYE